MSRTAVSGRTSLSSLWTRGWVIGLVLGLAITVGHAATSNPLLYTTDTASQSLYTFSTADASASLVGPFGVDGSMADLAYDARHNILYGTTTRTDNLYAINRVTGAASLVGPLGVSLMHSVAYDNVNRVLYGISVADSALYRISTSTGQATLVGPTGITPGSLDTISGLDFDPTDNSLYGSKSGPSATGGIYRVDTATGQATLLFSSVAMTDLAFHPQTDVLYGVDNGVGLSPDALYTIDLNAGTTSLVGFTHLGNNLGLAFAPVPEPTTLSLLGLGSLALVMGRRRT